MNRNRSSRRQITLFSLTSALVALLATLSLSTFLLLASIPQSHAAAIELTLVPEPVTEAPKTGSERAPQQSARAKGGAASKIAPSDYGRLGPPPKKLRPTTSGLPRGTTKAIKAPAPTQAQSKNDGAGFSFYGRATWYNPCDPNQNHGWRCVGTCDNYLDDSSYVVAMNVQQYSPWMCTRACVDIHDIERGITKRFTVADSCQACGYGGIDLTPAALRAFGRSTWGWEDAEFPIRWKFC